jgi:hypothetical protein
MSSCNHLFSMLSKSHLIPFLSVSRCLTPATISSVFVVSTSGAWIPFYSTNCKCHAVKHLKAIFSILFIHSLVYTLHLLLNTAANLPILFSTADTLQGLCKTLLIPQPPHVPNFSKRGSSYNDYYALCESSVHYRWSNQIIYWRNLSKSK